MKKFILCGRKRAAQTRGGGVEGSPRVLGWRVNCAAMFVHRAVRDRFASAKLRNNIVLCKQSASYQKGGAKDGWEFTALFGGYFSP